METIRSLTHPRAGSGTWSALFCLSALFSTVPASAGGASFGYWTGDGGGRDHFSYAVIEPGSHMHGSFSTDEIPNGIGWLEEEVESTNRAVLWFALGDLSYVVRDPAAVRRAQEIIEPMSQLGAQQGELGRQQGELGRRQGELGRTQGELGALQGRIGALQSRFSAMQALADEASADEMSELRRQLEELKGYQLELGQRQRELGQHQRELGMRQRELGMRQRELGMRQREASRAAEAQLRTLAESSVRSGKAEELGGR